MTKSIITSWRMPWPTSSGKYAHHMTYPVQWSSLYSPFTHTKPDQNPDWKCPHVAEGWTTWHENEDNPLRNQIWPVVYMHLNLNWIQPTPEVGYVNWFTTSSCDFPCNRDNFVSQSDSRIQICYLIGGHGSWSYNWISVQSELEHLQEIRFSLIQI